ncbi:MAG: S8 family serine peptidase [Brumimicrobium sp.]
MKKRNWLSPFKTLYTVIIFGFSFILNAQQLTSNTGDCSDFEDGKLLLTVNDPEYILTSDNSGGLHANVDILNNFIDDFNLTEFSLAFPASQNLTNVYEVVCDCNEDSLKNKVLEMNTYYSNPEKIPLIEMLCQPYTPDDYSTVFNPDWALDLIDAKEAWGVLAPPTGIIPPLGFPASIVIGITDSNYDTQHEDLQFKIDYIDPNINGNNSNHGNAVAGSVAGDTDNGVGKSSIGFASRLRLYGMNYNYVLQASYDGCHVINMSWAAGCSFNSYYQQVINEVANNGTVLVAAAGNGNTCGGPTELVYPAAFDNVIAVSSISASDNHEDTPGDPNTTHQHNNSVDLVAPGYDVPIIIANNGYTTGNGSSFASPIVAGTVALMLAANPDLTIDEVERILKCTADDIYNINPSYLGLLGAGRLNAAEAVKMAHDFYYPSIKTYSSCSYGEGSASINLLSSHNYTIEWSNGDVGNTPHFLFADDYSVTVTNNCGISRTFDFTIDDILSDNDFDYLSDVEIISPNQQLIDINNDGIIRVRGKIVIKENVNYTINDEIIEFSRDLIPETIDLGHTHSGVIVEKGAKLTANNTTFGPVSICSVENYSTPIGFNSCISFNVSYLDRKVMWDGIQVWGDDFSIQQNNPNKEKSNLLPINLLKNGELNLENCIVQDAHVGVALYRRNLPFISNTPEYGRGLLHASSTNFVNNHVGVDFLSKNNVTNNSTILDCKFIANSDLIETGLYSGSGSHVFIRLQGVRKPFIAANTFNGMASSPIGERGTGIRSYGAGYVVESGNTGPVTPNTPPNPNVFNDLDQGIDIYSFGGATNTIRIKDNRFNNVYQGVTANGSNFDEISYNIFNVPLGDNNFNSWGLFLQTSSGFLATENTFNTSGTNDYTFGAVTRDVNLMNGELYKNTFNGDFSSATQAEGSANNQLQIDCNRYFGNNEFDWTVLSADLADQGECLPDPQAPATNVFNSCTAANESNIFSVANFDYSTQNQFKPDCNSTTVLIDICAISDSYENACPQLVTSPCPPCIVALGQQLDFTPPGLKRRKIKGELIRRLAQKGDVQQLVTVLTSEALPEDKKIIIPTRVKRKEFTEAREVMDSLEVNTFEDQKFVELFDVLITLGETERELEDLTPSEKSIIENVAYSSTEVSVQAEAVLAELNKSRYIRFPQGLPANTAMMMASDDSGTMAATKQPLQVSVYPNPSEGDVVIAFEEEQEALGYIVDATGRKVRTLAFNENDVHYEVTGLAHGFYTVFIHYSNGSSESKRLVIK